MSLTPSGTDMETTPLRPTQRRIIQPSGWRASREVEGLAGIGAGFATTMLPVAMASSTRAIHVLAPVTNQIWTTVGATVAGFSHVSELRRFGGDPDGYGVWRGIGLGTALTNPLLGAALSHTLDIEAFDSSLFFGNLLSGAMLVGSGMWLQTTLDKQVHPLTLQERHHNRGQYYAAGILMVSAIAWQATALGLDTYHRVEQAGGLLPDWMDGKGAGTAAITVGAFMTIGGFAAGNHARAHHHEQARIAGLTIGIVGLTAAIVGAGMFASSR